MARYIDADARTRHYQYHRPMAIRALREGWADTERAAILAAVAKLGERPQEEGLDQRRWDRRIESLREQYRAINRQETRNRWLAGEIDCPADIAEEFKAAGQAIPSWLRRR